jgi:carbon starvation protein
MFAVTLTALVLLIKANLTNYILLAFGVALFILAFVLMFEAKRAFAEADANSIEK